ncbi:MAG: hypothetical protein ACXABF_16600 [Candidatus Thorarchaeota archaeon]
MLKKIYESTQTIGFTSPSSSVTYWIEQLNALVMIGTTVNKHETYRIYRDGTALRTGQFSTNGDSLHVDQAPEVDGGLAINSQINWSDVLQMHPISSTFNVQKPFSTGITVSFSNEGVYLRNRAGVLKYYEQFARGYRRRDAATEALEATVEVYASGASVGHPLMWAGDQRIAFFRGDDIVVFDVDAEVPILTSIIDNPFRACIDVKNQNVVSIRDSDKIIQVYDLSIEPASISAVTGSPGLFDRYTTETVSVTVLGSDGEPVVNQAVEWEVATITGVGSAVNTHAVNEFEVNHGAENSPAKGKISPNVSYTNASGIATATYCPPGLDWVSMDQETIFATVKI